MDPRSLGKRLLLLAAVVSLVWVVPSAALDSNVRIVRLSFISGDVQLDRHEGQGYERAIMNMPIVQGNRLWTRGEDALAEVEFEDGSTLRLAPGATVEFQELWLRNSGEKVSSIELRSGTAYLDVHSHMGEFRITAGGQQISVTHPVRFRVFADNGQFKVAVYKGDLDVRSGENQVEVRNGETFTLDLSDSRQYNLAKSITEGSYDDWNQERERYTESYGSAATYSADSNYDSFSPAYSYGLADLAYYGNYFYAPGWGLMWRPYYAAAGWNPFMDGAWAWYPQFGYAWVSPYPWGWMPYRYGSWNFVPGYGWAWAPGNAWTAWSPVTGVNHPPTGWAGPHPPLFPPQPGSADVVPVGKGWSAAVGGPQAPAPGTVPHRGWSAASMPFGWAENNGIVRSFHSDGATLLPAVGVPAAKTKTSAQPASAAPHGASSPRPRSPMRGNRPASPPARGMPGAPASHSMGGGFSHSPGGSGVSHGGGGHR